MGRKGLTLLAVAAVLLIGGYLWLQREEGSAPAPRERWLPELTGSATISAIEIDGGGEPRVRLVREAGGWVLPDKEGYPAATQPLGDLLRGLAEAEKVEARTANPQLHARLGLSDEGDGAQATRLRVELSGGDVLDLRIGNPATHGAGQLVRRADEDQVWLTNRNIDLPTTELAWLDRRITRIPFGSIRELDVHYADGERLTVYREDRSKANLKVRQLPKERALPFEAAANGMATLFANLQLNDALPLEQLPFDRERPLLRFTLQTFDDGRLDGAIYQHGEQYWLTLPAREGLSEALVPVRENWALSIEPQYYKALAKRLRNLLGEN